MRGRFGTAEAGVLLAYLRPRNLGKCNTDLSPKSIMTAILFLKYHPL